MRKTITRWVSVAAMAVGIAAGAVVTVAVVAQCPTEDSRNCYWNARTQGNGVGQSFVDINGNAVMLPW